MKDLSQVNVSITTTPRASEGIGLTVSHAGRLEFPSEFPMHGLQTAQRDFSILAQKLEKHPEEIRQLLRQVVAGNNAQTKDLVARLGLSESDFVAEGGGMFWAIVVIGVLCCASEAY